MKKWFLIRPPSSQSFKYSISFLNWFRFLAVGQDSMNYHPQQKPSHPFTAPDATLHRHGINQQGSPLIASHPCPDLDPIKMLGQALARVLIVTPELFGPILEAHAHVGVIFGCEMWPRMGMESGRGPGYQYTILRLGKSRSAHA